jgi:Polyketide cyclase / dehydrase and lipid transport
VASIRKAITIDVPSEEVWQALRDWGALHERFVPGFVVDCRLHGDDRIVTFASGLELREVLVDLDDEARRLVWSVVDGPYTHHNGVAQVFTESDRRTRFVWTADLLPNEAAASTADAMQLGTEVAKKTLEARAAAKA